MYLLHTGGIEFRYVSKVYPPTFSSGDSLSGGNTKKTDPLQISKDYFCIRSENLCLKANANVPGNTNFPTCQKTSFTEDPCYNDSLCY